VKGRTKSALGRVLFATGVGRRLLGRAAVVVTFHRVQNGADPRGLSVSSEMFEQCCRFFKDAFHVVPLGELIARLERGRPVDRCLAITFDDGYADNFDNARPVLEALSLPATFFIVSGWMESGVWPWWDREQGIRHRWMTWTQVRELHTRGFEIGAHTRTHVDLGRADEALAVEEIGGARRDLEERLGARVDLFAYPYGGRDHLTEANRAVVKAAGFRCCCSCYGGLAAADVDPFRLQRVAVSGGYDSPAQFALDLVREPRPHRTFRRRRCCEMSEAIGY